MGKRGPSWLCGAYALAASGCILLNYDEVAPDAGDASSEDAGTDSSRTIDATRASDATRDRAMCASPNACGGCGALSALPGVPCGKCGVGRYACNGTEDTVCTGDGPAKSSGGALLIDDFEDGDQYPYWSSGLSGAWYPIYDGTLGLLDPAPGTVPLPANVGADGSMRSMHVSGTGFALWGAGIAVSLSAYACSYDASAQTGIGFYSKGSGTVYVGIGTRQTVAPAYNGACTIGCGDVHVFKLALTDTWTYRSIPYASLAQLGWGTQVRFDPTQLLYIQFTFAPTTNLDLYVDKLSFY